MDILSVEINHVAVEGPDEREVQGVVEGSRALHRGVLAHRDVSVQRGQNNPCGICVCREEQSAGQEEARQHALTQQQTDQSV